jgi:hypothetical protein
MKLKVLLRQGAEETSETSVLVIAQVMETTLETLSGKAVPEGGIVAEADCRDVMGAAEAAARERATQFATAERLRKDVVWMARELDPYEVGSRVGLGYTNNCAEWFLDFSQAKPIDRAPGLAEGDMVVIGPSAPLYVNARARVGWIHDEAIAVSLETGDRERIERGTGQRLPKSTILSRFSVEKLEGGS